MKMTLRLGIACSFGWLLNACPSDQAPLGTGELGKGDLRIVCADDDAVCASGATSLDAAFPIAVGASIQVVYDGPVPTSPTGGPSTMTIFSASPAMLSKDEASFVAWMPGVAALLARTQEGTVADFVHLTLASVQRLELDSSPEPLVVGGKKVWKVAPLGADGAVLAGSLSYTWEVEGTTVEIVESAGRSVQLSGKQPGTAILRVKTGGVVGEVTLTVEAP